MKSNKHYKLEEAVKIFQTKLQIHLEQTKEFKQDLLELSVELNNNFTGIQNSIKSLDLEDNKLDKVFISKTGLLNKKIENGLKQVEQVEKILNSSEKVNLVYEKEIDKRLSKLKKIADKNNFDFTVILEKYKHLSDINENSNSLIGESKEIIDSLKQTLTNLSEKINFLKLPYLINSYTKSAEKLSEKLNKTYKLIDNVANNNSIEFQSKNSITNSELLLKLKNSLIGLQELNNNFFADLKIDISQQGSSVNPNLSEQREKDKINLHGFDNFKAESNKNIDKNDKDNDNVTNSPLKNKIS